MFTQKKKLQSFAIGLKKAVNDLVIPPPRNLQTYSSIAKYLAFKYLD